jgi:hypothetical protein
MWSPKRVQSGAAAGVALALWLLVALQSPGAPISLLLLAAPAALIGFSLGWLVHGFGGKRLTWLAAARSALLGAAFLTPGLRALQLIGNLSTLSSAFIILIALSASAVLGGTLWGIAGAVDDAFDEWRSARRRSAQSAGSAHGHRLHIPGSARATRTLY